MKHKSFSTYSSDQLRCVIAESLLEICELKKENDKLKAALRNAMKTVEIYSVDTTLYDYLREICNGNKANKNI